MHADQPAGGRVADPVGDLGFVDGVVEHRANVVGHAAVDRDVAAPAGNVLDRADRVEREPGVGDQRAARLAEDPDPLRQPLEHGFGVGRRRRRGLVAGVGGGEAAAHVDDRVVAGGDSALRRGCRRRRARRPGSRGGRGGRGPRARRRAQRSTARGSSASGMPNFESSWPVAILCGCSGRIPGVTRSRTRCGAPGGDPLEPLDLIERVDDDVADAGARAPVRARRRSCCCRACRSARGRSRRSAPGAARRPRRRRRRGPPRRRAAAPRCRGKPCSRRRPRSRRCARRRRHRIARARSAHVVLGVDVGGRAELGRELDQVAAADLDAGRARSRGCPAGRRQSPRSGRPGPVHAPP